MNVKFIILLTCLLFDFENVDGDSMVNCYSCMDVVDCATGHCLGDYCASITINNVGELPIKISSLAQCEGMLEVRGFSTIVKTCVDDSVRSKYISEERPCRRYDFSNGFLTDVCICGSDYCNI